MSTTLNTKKSQPSKPIFLIGPTHVGKSSVGKKLGSQLDCAFFDLDAVIEKNAGVDIQTIFDFEKEQGFRDRETKALESIDRNRLSVVATGAGIILREKNREIIKKGVVIYLSASVELLSSRVREDSNRPLFKGKNPIEVLQNMHTIRHPLYQECADYQIEVLEGVHTNQVLSQIYSFL